MGKIASREPHVGDPIEIEIHTSPSLSSQINIVHASSGKWIDEIVKYIDSGTLPEDPVKAKKIRRQSPRYILYKNVLYMRFFSRPLLRSVPPNMTDVVIKELHEGVYGGHPGARTLSERVINQGYYWPTLRKDAQNFVHKCHSCQIYGDVPRLPSIE